MTANFLDGKKGRSLDNIIAKLSKVRSSKTGDRILLISEKNNACLSLSSDEGEDGEADLHQCGSCKEMFTNLSSYIMHKIEKPCRGPSRPPNHGNENEMEADEEMHGKDSPGANKRMKIENDVNQDSHKKKHDRKGMARKLNMAELEAPLINENHISQNDNDNQVVVVVSGDSEAERRYIHENEVSMAGMRPHDRREEYSPRRQKDGDDAAQRNMPYLERIPNYTFEGTAMYPPAGVPGYLPKISDRTMMNHELEKDSVYRERIGQKACGNERDGREPWPFTNKPTGFYRGPNELPGHYGAYPHSNLYSPQYSISHPSSYHRYSNAMHTTQAGKSCCSPAYASHPHYPADLYTIPIEEYNKGLYNKDRSEPPLKPQLEHETEVVPKEASQSSPKGTEKSADQPDVIKERSLNTNEEESAEPAVTNKGEDNAKEVDKETMQNADANQQTTEMDRPPQLVKLPSPTSKENSGSPYSSQRLDSNETNSQGGRSRGSSMSPAESAISSSNQSLDHVISPSQVYERTSFAVSDDISEDASKQSMEPESPFQAMSTAEDDVTSPKSKQTSNDAAFRGSENITPQDSRPSFIHDKGRDSDASFERRGEMFKPDGSPPNDPSWRHSKQVYRCPLCAKIFPFKSKLQRHVLVHTGIKPYKCNVCGRGFTQQIDLQRHLTRHTGEKPFKCHLCKAQFIRADNLRKHAKDTHFVNIEEPIRKRRRKTTGSDTVLPPLEVAIAMAINETEKNGGRVLGRAGNRGNRGGTRRERMTSVEDDQRRMEPGNETFARPTMGTVSSHQYPVGPPSMGYPPHAPSMPPFPRISSEMYEPMVHERGSPPPRLPNPPRYHPGSMVFQPRPDRYMERPYFARPPGDIPAMYWSSPQRHALLSPSELGHLPNRDRFNSEASEGSSTVFEGRDDAGKSDAADGPVDLRSNLIPASRQERRMENDSERFGPQDDERASHKSLPLPQHSEMFHRSPAVRYGYPGELRSPHMSDERPVHILDERGRFTQERMRSAEERLRGVGEPSLQMPPLSSESRNHKEAEERLPRDEAVNQSPTRGSVSSSSEMVSYHMNRSNGEGPPFQDEAKATAVFAYSGDERLKEQNLENRKKYENGKLESVPNQNDGFVKQKIESPDGKLIDVKSTG